MRTQLTLHIMASIGGQFYMMKEGLFTTPKPYLPQLVHIYIYILVYIHMHT
jgi:hypothetical protein